MLGQSQSGIASLSKQTMQRTSRASNHFWTEIIRIKARALQNRCNYTHNWGFTTINPDPDPDGFIDTLLQYYGSSMVWDKGGT